MSTTSVDKHLAREPVFVLRVVSRKVQNAKATCKILLIDVVLDMRNDRSAWIVAAAWIAEVVGDVSESVDFKLLELVEGHFVKEPVYNHAAFDSTLGVQDEDHFLLLLI